MIIIRFKSIWMSRQTNFLFWNVSINVGGCRLIVCIFSLFFKRQMCLLSTDLDILQTVVIVRNLTTKWTLKVTTFLFQFESDIRLVNSSPWTFNCSRKHNKSNGSILSQVQSTVLNEPISSLICTYKFGTRIFRFIGLGSACGLAMSP